MWFTLWFFILTKIQFSIHFPRMFCLRNNNRISCIQFGSIERKRKSDFRQCRHTSWPRTCGNALSMQLFGPSWWRYTASISTEQSNHLGWFEKGPSHFSGIQWASQVCQIAARPYCGRARYKIYRSTAFHSTHYIAMIFCYHRGYHQSLHIYNSTATVARLRNESESVGIVCTMPEQ